MNQQSGWLVLRCCHPPDNGSREPPVGRLGWDMRERGGRKEMLRKRKDKLVKEVTQLKGEKGQGVKEL